MRPIKLRTETLTILHIIHDCTTGSPKGRESYGDGDPIVVDGVTTIQGGWRQTSYRAKGVRSCA